MQARDDVDDVVGRGRAAWVSWLAGCVGASVRGCPPPAPIGSAS
jgi:hypothetical protein